LPGLDVATYEVISNPPLSRGAVKLSCADLVPVAITFVMLGALGIVGARVEAEVIDEGDEPLLLIATTVKEYVTPGVRPVIFAAFIWAGVYVATTASGLDVTGLEVIRTPPSSVGVDVSVAAIAAGLDVTR